MLKLNHWLKLWLMLWWWSEKHLVFNIKQKQHPIGVLFSFDNYYY